MITQRRDKSLDFEGYFLDIRSFTYCSIRDLVGKLSTSVHLTKHDQPAISHFYFIRIDAYNTVMPVIEQGFFRIAVAHECRYFDAICHFYALV